MKTTVAALGGLALVGGLALFASQQTQVLEVIKIKEVPMVETKTIDVLDERITEAQNASREEIESKAQEAFDAYVAKEMQRIGDEVKATYIQEIEATISGDAAY